MQTRICLLEDLKRPTITFNPSFWSSSSSEILNFMAVHFRRLPRKRWWKVGFYHLLRGVSKRARALEGAEIGKRTIFRCGKDGPC
jgi:hypothetical protein